MVSTRAAPTNDMPAPGGCQFFCSPSQPPRHRSETEGLTRVAAFAILEVVAAEGPSIVVTGHAASRAGRAEVLRGLRRADLTALRGTGADRVTVGATETRPPAVLRVAEADAEGPRVCPRAAISAGRMARTARAQVAPARAGVRCVTLEAVRVRVEPGGDTQRDAAPQGLVTGGTAFSGPSRAGRVGRVIELRVEALQAGKGFDGRVTRIEIRVAVGAELRARRDELLKVTIRAGPVTRRRGARRVVGATMTGVAGERGVLRDRVREDRPVRRERRGAEEPDAGGCRRGSRRRRGGATSQNGQERDGTGRQDD